MKNIIPIAKVFNSNNGKTYSFSEIKDNSILLVSIESDNEQNCNGKIEKLIFEAIALLYRNYYECLYTKFEDNEYIANVITNEIYSYMKCIFNKDIEKEYNVSIQIINYNKEKDILHACSLGGGKIIGIKGNKIKILTSSPNEYVNVLNPNNYINMATTVFENVTNKDLFDRIITTSRDTFNEVNLDKNIKYLLKYYNEKMLYYYLLSKGLKTDILNIDFIEEDKIIKKRCKNDQSIVN